MQHTFVYTVDLKYWAENVSDENNHLVKILARLRPDAEVTEADLRVAQRTVSQRFVVGLMNQMEESIHRFNIVLGIDEMDEGNAECMDEFFGHGMKKSNSNSHPKVSISNANAFCMIAMLFAAMLTPLYIYFRLMKVIQLIKSLRRKIGMIYNCTTLSSVYLKSKEKLSCPCKVRSSISWSWMRRMFVDM